MSEPTKALTPTKYGEIRLREIPLDKLDALEQAIRNIMELSGMRFALEKMGASEEATLSLDEVFPDMGPGDALAGARKLAEMTQAGLAEKIGAHRHHISEMERGVRPISSRMAKALAKALGTNYKIFL